MGDTYLQWKHPHKKAVFVVQGCRGGHMEAVPKELLLYIFDFFPGISKFPVLALVCKRFNAVVNDPVAWRDVAVQVKDLKRFNETKAYNRCRIIHLTYCRRYSQDPKPSLSHRLISL